MILTVAHATHIAGRGIAVFFVEDPIPFLPWKPHHVRVNPPGLASFDAIGTVEFARKFPPGEIMALLFSDYDAADFPTGTEIAVLGVVEDTC